VKKDLVGSGDIIIIKIINNGGGEGGKKESLTTWHAMKGIFILAIGIINGIGEPSESTTGTTTEKGILQVHIGGRCEKERKDDDLHRIKGLKEIHIEKRVHHTQIDENLIRKDTKVKDDFIHNREICEMVVEKDGNIVIHCIRSKVLLHGSFFFFIYRNRNEIKKKLSRPGEFLGTETVHSIGDIDNRGAEELDEDELELLGNENKDLDGIEDDEEKGFNNNDGIGPELAVINSLDENIPGIRMDKIKRDGSIVVIHDAGKKGNSIDDADLGPSI